ncbi:hypothetical protein AALP_AAs62683U000100, partial [Arabis alpina]
RGQLRNRDTTPDTILQQDPRDRKPQSTIPEEADPEKHGYSNQEISGCSGSSTSPESHRNPNQPDPNPFVTKLRPDQTSQEPDPNPFVTKPEPDQDQPQTRIQTTAKTRPNQTGTRPRSISNQNPNQCENPTQPNRNPTNINLKPESQPPRKPNPTKETRPLRLPQSRPSSNHNHNPTKSESRPDRISMKTQQSLWSEESRGP